MIADEFVQAAIKSGRLEILDVCWKNRHVGALFWDEYRKLPEGHLKDQLFSLKLRSTYTRWPDDNKIKIYSLNPRFGLVDFFIPVLQKIHSRPAERLFRSEYP